MSSSQEEPPITAPLEERPSIEPRRIRQVTPRELAYRFLAGALTSIVAGAIALAAGPPVGGIMLAFPAILAASLTLIEEQEDSAEAREDARGATIGAAALAVFAGVAALTLGHLSGALALAIAAIAWFATAFLGYAIAWLR